MCSVCVCVHMYNSANKGRKVDIEREREMSNNDNKTDLNSLAFGYDVHKRARGTIVILPAVARTHTHLKSFSFISI